MPTHFLNLQLFAEEVAVVDSGVATGEVAESTVADGVATEGTDEQVAPVEVDQTEPTWDDLIKGKFKDDYNRSVKDAVSKRFKNQRDLQAQIDMIDPMVKALAQRYGVAANADGSIPIDRLSEVFMADDQMYEKEAFERGMSVEDLKQIKKLEAENLQLRHASEQTQKQKEWDEVLRQGDETKQFYPNFDLDTEMQNPQFGRLLATMQRSGFPNAVRTAYEAVHRDEIMGGAMKYAVSQTEAKISNSIQSGMRRPQENGTSHQSSASVGAIDPSKLTKADIDDLKRRAERGEKITF